MAIKVGEAGKTIVIGTSYDMSSKTSLTVTILDPSGNTTTVADGSITLNSGTYDAGSLGTFAANESLQFDTTAGMFDEAGTWSAYVTYVDAGKTLYSDTFTLTIEAVP